MADTSNRVDPEPLPAPDDETGPTIPPGPGPVVAQRRAAERAVARPPSPSPRPPSGNGMPETPEEMRIAIDATRTRMSDTLDALEAELVREKQSLVEKKDELWAKLTLQDFRRAVSREPWRSVAIAFAAGYIVAAIRD